MVLTESKQEAEQEKSLTEQEDNKYGKHMYTWPRVWVQRNLRLRRLQVCNSFFHSLVCLFVCFDSPCSWTWNGLHCFWVINFSYIGFSFSLCQWFYGSCHCFWIFFYSCFNFQLKFRAFLMNMNCKCILFPLSSKLFLLGFCFEMGVIRILIYCFNFQLKFRTVL